jgi:hypothetical protein
MTFLALARKQCCIALHKSKFVPVLQVSITGSISMGWNTDGRLDWGADTCVVDPDRQLTGLFLGLLGKSLHLM